MQSRGTLRKSFALTVWAMICVAALLAPAHAQDWPTRPVRMVVNFPPGGVADQIGRVLAVQLQQAFGQPFIVDNRSGGNGNIGAGEVAKAPADGYTLLMSPANVITTNGQLDKLPFDPMKDFEPIASTAIVTVFLVVRPGLPVSTLPEFIAYLRANPGRLNYGSPGTGSSPHLAAELFKRDTKVRAEHVPYKGAAPALTDLLGGQIDFMFDPGVALPHIRSGKLRLLAVGNMKRSAAFPDTPTVGEVLGTEFDAGTVFGLFAPTATPRAITARLSSEIGRIMQTQEMGRRIAALGAEPLYLATDAFALRLRRTHEWVGVLIKDTGMHAD
jgi:tripartite-type tricarboxylate transporter receptor subunit TctC